MRLIKILGLSCALGVLSASACAQDAYVDLAQMLTVQQAKASRAMLASGLIDNIHRSIRATIPGGDSEKAKEALVKTKPALDKYMKSIEAALFSVETQSVMRSAIEASIRKVYTSEEALAQLNFFRSPQGATVYEKTGALAAEIAQIAPQLMQTIAAGPMRELMEDVTALQKEK
jgi:hypothetical protein